MCQWVDHKSWGPVVAELLQAGVRCPSTGVDKGDHPPITPMRRAEYHDLRGGDEWRVYEYVVRHFLATLMPDYVFTCITARIQIGAEEFYSTCNQVRTAQMCPAGLQQEAVCSTTVG